MILHGVVVIPHLVMGIQDSLQPFHLGRIQTIDLLLPISGKTLM